MRILLADDDVIMRRDSARNLRLLGHAVHEAGNVHEAVSAMMQASVHGFDAVITDHDMPGGSGSDLARQLRAIGFRGMIVCYTGGNLLGVVDHGLFYRLLQKPVPLGIWREILG